MKQNSEKKLPEREKDVQRAILDYLAWKKIFHYRQNTGAMVSEYKGAKRFMRFGAKGSPDIVAVISGRYIGIECKGSNGKQSADQIIFQRDLELAGGLYVVAYSLDDIKKVLK